MLLKLILGIVGAILVLVFLGPIVLKLHLLALSVVVAIGVILMAYDLWQSAHEDDR
ncbi:MAG: hypothetical protein ABJA83_10020 [Burkholderiaceae bacterium]